MQEIIDGYMRNLFRTSKPITGQLAHEYPGTWICDLINSDPDTANAVILKKLESSRSTTEKIRFLYDVKYCIEYALKEYEFVGASSHIKTTCCDWIQEGMERHSLEAVKGIYEAALIKIDSAICRLNEEQNLDCSSLNTAPENKFTNCQWVLIYYYFFDFMGLEWQYIDRTNIARFFHLVTGKKFKIISNTDFYAKLKLAPNKLKSDKKLVEDLEIIKKYFQEVGLKEIVLTIDNEISVARRERKKSA